MRKSFLIASLLCARLATAAEVVVSDVPYARTRNGEPIFGDWYVPDGATGELPTIIHVHGGGWIEGNKVSTNFPTFLRDGDYILFSVNYRLAAFPVAGNNTSPGIWPTQIQDVRAAIRFVRSQAGTPIAGTSATVASDRIGLFGTSAGGLLVVHGALTHDDCGVDNPSLSDALIADACISCAVKAVVASVPVLDLLEPTPGVNEATYLADAATYQAYLLGGSVGSRLELAGEASPVTHVRPDQVPIFIINRTSDDLISTNQADDFVAASEAVGATNVTLRTEAGEHGVALDTEDQAAILAFLGENL